MRLRQAAQATEATRIEEKSQQEEQRKEDQASI